MLTTSARRAAAPGRVHRERHVGEARTECASVEQAIADAGGERLADMDAAQVEAVGQPVHLERDTGRERRLERALEVERVLGAMPDQAPRRMAETAGCWVLHRVDHAGGELPPWRPLSGVERELNPVELCEHVVG